MALDTTQQLMVITMEEAGELTQVCSKVLRRAKIDEEYQTKLVEELGDLQCMINLMIKHKVVTLDQIQARVKVKHEKLKKWSDLID